MSQAPSAAELAAINQITATRQRALVEVFEAGFASNFQSPVVFLDNMQLQSPLSVRFYRRDFAYLSKQLYLEYQYRSWRGYNPEVLDRYNEVITKKLTNINIMFTNTINRLEKLLQQNSVVMESSLFPNPVTVTVPVIASHARAYFQLLSDLDRVNLLAGTANLLGVIDSKQRTEAEFICKKAVRAFRSILMNEVAKLYREAKRVMEEQKNGGKVDPSMSAIVAEQGKEIAAFESSADEGSEADSALAIGNADPSQLIDDAAAAAVAASAATKGRKKAATTTA
ncbi:MAG: hypothetical protein K5880_10445 [Hydrogenophaga sp.]|uniref:hypothetical protein n=1 Tax=Hydrogenophaga sp. TaxID=1904254 RepID=UPI00260C56AE|nr:hypothetical protein [Hydrogenophaga sp.]MCV0439042.1 hypothetical protein [Hydrogenophaga sp.]